MKKETIRRKMIDGDLYWKTDYGYAYRIKNDYVPEGEKPFWQYWIFRFTHQERRGMNERIDTVESLEEAKKILHSLTPKKI